LSDPSYGSYEICPVCFWEDDLVQNEDPSYAGGANQVSLNEARRNYIEFGAAEARCRAHVRQPKADEVPLPYTLGGSDSELRGSKERGVKIVLLGLVRSMKSKHIGVLQGCDAIASVSWPVNSEGTLEECLRLFVGVASEIDDMPTRATRQFWSTEALAKKDTQMAEYEARIQAAVMEACDRLETALLRDLQG
jgi:hypothetical protein